MEDTTNINRLGYLLQHAAEIMSRQADQMLQERLGIGMSQFKILALLQDHPDTGQRTISEHLGQTEASISRQVKLLITRGMLTSTVDPAERRRRIAALTPKGAKMTEAARDALAQYRQPLFEPLSAKQQEQLLDMLDRLHDHVCQSGKPYACDRPFDLLDAYALQQSNNV